MTWTVESGDIRWTGMAYYFAQAIQRALGSKKRSALGVLVRAKTAGLPWQYVDASTALEYASKRQP